MKYDIEQQRPRIVLWFEEEELQLVHDALVNYLHIPACGTQTSAEVKAEHDLRGLAIIINDALRTAKDN